MQLLSPVNSHRKLGCVAIFVFLKLVSTKKVETITRINFSLWLRGFSLV